MSAIRNDIYNLEEIIIYMINNKASVRKACDVFNVERSKLSRSIKKYNGSYKIAIESLLKENKINSQKNCGNNRWHKTV